MNLEHVKNAFLTIYTILELNCVHVKNMNVSFA